MPYSITVKTTIGSNTVTVYDQTENTTSTSLTLVGMSYKGYGMALNQDMVNLMQQWAGNSSPSNPSLGQSWLNTSTSPVLLNFYDGGAWNPLATQAYVNSAVSAASAAETAYIESLLGSSLAGNTLHFTGDVTGSGVNSIALTLAGSGVTAGQYEKVTVNSKGLVTAGAQLTSQDIITALGYTPGTSSVSGSFLPLTGGALSGDLTITSGNVDGNQLRLIQPNGNYAAILHNDGSYFSILLTNAGDINGTYNGLRPFYITCATGLVTMSNGLQASSAGGGSLTLNATAAILSGPNSYINLDASGIGLSGLAYFNNVTTFSYSGGAFNGNFYNNAILLQEPTGGGCTTIGFALTNSTGHNYNAFKAGIGVTGANTASFQIASYGNSDPTGVANNIIGSWTMDNGGNTVQTGNAIMYGGAYMQNFCLISPVNGNTNPCGSGISGVAMAGAPTVNGVTGQIAGYLNVWNAYGNPVYVGSGVTGGVVDVYAPSPGSGTQYIGGISSNGNLTVSFVTSSDYRLKQDVQPIEDAETIVMGIPVYRFAFKAAPDATQPGFLAHEVQQHLPHVVHGDKDGMETLTGVMLDRDDHVIRKDVSEDEVRALVAEHALYADHRYEAEVTRPKHQMLDYGAMIPALWAHTQSLTTKLQQRDETIRDLTCSLADLIKRVEALEAKHAG